MHQKIPHILFLFFTVFAYGQVTLAVSEVKEVKVNQRFNLTVLLEISGENMEQQTPLQMPDLSKFDIIGTASERNTIVLDASKGNVINQLVFQTVLVPKNSGKLKIGSALVTVNGKIYKTEPFDVNVREERTKAIADNTDVNDLYLNLEIQDKNVYKNEPVKAVLRAYSRNYNNFRKLGDVHITPQKNIKIKPVSYTKSEIESRQGIGSQVIGVFMIFPNESGTVEIDPISASFSPKSTPHKISSNAVKLNVKKLPAGMPRHFKNAVGNFSVELSNNSEDELLEIDKPLNIALKVSGKGNVETLQLPNLQSSPDYTFYPPKITSNSSAKQNELSGSTIAEYIVVPKKTGLISLKFEDFSYFDPTLNSYTDLGAQELILDIKTPQQIADSKSTIEKVNDYTNTVLETVNTPVLQTQHLKVNKKETINWKVVFGNFALLSTFALLFVFVLRKKEKRKQKKLAFAATPLSSPTIAETEEMLRKHLTNHFEENIEYLKILKNDNNFSKFFSTFEDLNRETMQAHGTDSQKIFQRKLEAEKGQQLSEKYRILTERIQMEKFSPLHSEEEINELFEGIKSIFSDINK